MSVIDEITCNGHPVIFSLRVVTEPGEGWKGSRFIGSYDNLKDLNRAIAMTDVPLYWVLEIDFEDKPND